MKLVVITFAALATIATATPTTPEFYFQEQDVTCHHPGSDAGIQCEQGHLRNAPVFSGNQTEVAEGSLQKRLSCIKTEFCWTHCFLRGMCNASCDRGFCHCFCEDIGAPWRGYLPCQKKRC